MSHKINFIDGTFFVVISLCFEDCPKEARGLYEIFWQYIETDSAVKAFQTAELFFFKKLLS